QGAPRWRKRLFASQERKSACSARKRSPTSTTRTRGCCGSSSPTAARSGPGGSRATAPSTSGTSPRPSRTPVRWRCCRTPAPPARPGERITAMSRTPMKLILTQEVTGLGAPGDVVEVAGGYGRNYLVPRGLAMRWTRGAEKQIDLIKRARAAREIRGLDDAKAAAERLATLQVRLQTRAGGGGRLFGSVSPADIAAAVRAAGGPELDRRRIEIKNPIKTVGAHQVSVRLHPEVTATMDVVVT